MGRSEAEIGEATVNLHHHGIPTKPVAHVGISVVCQVQGNQIINENDRCVIIAVLQQYNTLFSQETICPFGSHL